MSKDDFIWCPAYDRLEEENKKLKARWLTNEQLKEELRHGEEMWNKLGRFVSESFNEKYSEQVLEILNKMTELRKM